MCLDSVVKVAQIVGYSVAGLSLLVAALTYKKNNKVKRGEWLKSLFEKFYEQEKFSSIRREIEYDSLDKFLGLENGQATKSENEEQLVNYLNFFEFISVLVKRGYLNQEEIKDIFGYYLKAINKHSFLKGFIKEYDFENLEGLLKKYE